MKTATIIMSLLFTSSFVAAGCVTDDGDDLDDGPSELDGKADAATSDALRAQCEAAIGADVLAKARASNPAAKLVELKPGYDYGGRIAWAGVYLARVDDISAGAAVIPADYAIFTSAPTARRGCTIILDKRVELRPTGADLTATQALAKPLPFACRNNVELSRGDFVRSSGGVRRELYDGGHAVVLYGDAAHSLGQLYQVTVAETLNGATKLWDYVGYISHERQGIFDAGTCKLILLDEVAESALVPRH